ncbi:UvrB/UvrC motif-containing protein, partial [Patescibacteria group bacterium]|nr:UvrB/UvrC motif-containing protein [Patescibacteria group bacterium]
CAAPCQDVQNIDKNNANIEKIKLFLSGKYKKVINDLKKELKLLSKNNDYEKAIIVRDKLEYYDKLSTKYLNEVELLQNVGNLEDYKQNVLSLFEILSGYFPLIKDNLEDRSRNFLIEFFDISNLGDKFIVGANISLLNGNFYKKGYKKYKIKTIQSQNDFYAMKEMITRRLKNLDKWGRPDLIVLDGGKGQLSVCIKLLEDANIPVIAIAKQEEEIYLKFKQKFYKIKLSKFNKALMVLIKGRNEVHRFVLSYNKNLRKL